MSFVINTTIDKNAELLDAYKQLYMCDEESKDVVLISKSRKIAIDSFALALSSDFFRQILETETKRRDIVNIIIPDIEPQILEKIVEYIYIGTVSIDPKRMSDFIEACNLLQLKANISCERKLVFDSKPSTTFSFKPQPVASTPVAKKSNLDSLIAELEHEEQENVEYMKQEGEDMGGQILEVYEISNIDGTEIAYEEEEEMSGEEQYELLNVVSDSKEEVSPVAQPGKAKKQKVKEDYSEIKQRSPAKPVDEDTMKKAISEIITNNCSFRIVSEKYQIPKTLLWRRAKKEGYVKGDRFKDTARLEAIEAIKQGESLISLSKKFNIPISTLHREKLKLYERGQLPESVNFKVRSRGDDYETRLRNAISEILNGKSQNEIAKKYSIPKTTIWRIIKKMDPAQKNQPGSVHPDSKIVDELITLSKKRSTFGVKEEASDNEGKHAVKTFFQVEVLKQEDN